jgi:hypothetical protein
MGGSNRMLEPGSVSTSAPYFISGRSGTITALAAGDAVARLIQFGMADPRTPGAIVPTPIQISQIRIKYLPVTALTASIGFEIQKGTATTQHSGGASHTPKRRKTTGYPAIDLTETSLHVSTTVAIAGGSVWAPVDADTAAPLDVMTLGGGAGFAGSQTIWTPSDLCPLQLEAGEALEVRANVAMTGTGIFFVAFDFLR